MTKNSKVLDKLVKARSVLILSAPFYGCLALHLKWVCGDKILFSSGPVTTMAVDGISLFYCTEFVMKITELELLGVLVHEVSHCSHRHFGRLMGRDPMIWNIAGDFVINPEILDAGYKLPGKPKTLDEILAGENGYLLDPMFKDWSTEEIYKYTKKKVDEKRKKDQKDNGEPGNGKSTQVLDPGGCGGILEPQPDENGKAKDQSQVEFEWETITRQAINVAKANNEGRVPGHLEKLVAELQAPRVNWHQQLRKWADQSMRKEVTWQKPNKRFLHMGLYLPGTKSNGISHLVVGVDTSASVDQELLEKEFASEIASFLDQGFCDKITVIYADTQIGRVDEFIAGDVLKLDAVPRGGTDFRATFKYITENCNDASGVIYFSDMYVSQYGEAPTCPVLWATYGRKSNFNDQAAKIPFGDVIHIH